MLKYGIIQLQKYYFGEGFMEKRGFRRIGYVNNLREYPFKIRELAGISSQQVLCCEGKLNKIYF